MQEEIINSVLERKDTLALMPTGGGKSICFQIPALAQEGLCLVITPLIALMRDQVENLRKKGIKAAAIYSGLHRFEIDLILDNCLFGDTKLLYVSPERIASNDFREALRRMKLNLIAVDEAHCISQWGYDFRPPYLKVAEIRPYFPLVPVLALTATATPEVVEDIQERLAFRKSNILKKSFERKNLSYSVVKEEDKNGRLLRILSRVHGCGIIYARNRRKTREVSEFLQSNHVSADYYHAGLSTEVRNRKQIAWINGETRVIVATNAFGMGIDKPNVRFVIHLDIPDSLEAYFQEAGRAGRDEKMAYAIMLYNDADIVALKRNLRDRFPSRDTIKSVYHALGNFFQLAVGSGKEVSFDFHISEFSSSYDFKPIVVYNSLKFLEKEGYLLYSDSSDAPSKLYFPLEKEDLYRFQIENPRYDKLIKTLLRSYSGLLSDFVKINEVEIANRLNTSREEVVKVLEKLNQLEVLAYIPRKTVPQIMYLQERLDKKDLRISAETYQDRKESAQKRIQAVVDYVTSDNKCRSWQLLSYFGEKEMKRCGVCDVCKNRNKIEVNEMEFDTIVDLIKPILKKHPRTLLQLIKEIPNVNEEKMIKVIQWLKDNDKIEEHGDEFHWKTQFSINF